mmetsp:Transcript_20582/g.28762  ORF Transcript_20582/g.28762 Transcript_20582/m.28762 type:complete len:159 (+) Transcript_20582:71-547(+)|eukprot:CAMPEP_0184487212 /NCGR_PEP_ID=MMETSP0113_2-20130426/9491_1 /TAXON_ID=91329 /ORGANISM="Norrisiella sphaerica, Strain BC52" /LENGTH=158 /DNA_ID=CAMNT_0026869427 /DNA_START=71 /DNA_END=547 /DNA_ORIENTATION=+
MSFLSGPETKLLMRILERCVEDSNNEKWRSINLSKVQNKLSDTALIILQQAGFQRTDTHMVLPMTAAHDRQARAVYMACMESISFTVNKSEGEGRDMKEDRDRKEPIQDLKTQRVHSRDSKSVEVPKIEKPFIAPRPIPNRVLKNDPAASTQTTKGDN